jgi:N5-(cytidine 5'-diphosphoramidyl)-L-glutamine hydrolase
MMRIALTQRLERNKETNEVRNSLDSNWCKLLNSLGLIPIAIPSNIDLLCYKDINIEGLILTGGNDLSVVSNDELSVIRDTHEKKCLKYAIENSIPVFGVCRGMQIIADYFGSTFSKVRNHTATRHDIKIVGNNRNRIKLASIYNVNSFHNYAIDNLGDGLNINVICPEDSTIESIEHNKHKIFAVMWHPEREKQFEEENKQIISDFFNSCI